MATTSKKRKGSGSLLHLISTNPDINQDRDNGLYLIQKLGRTPHVATKGDIKWFWEDYELLGADLDLRENAKGYVEDNFEELNKKYPFELTEWFLGWYDFMPDIITKKIDNTGEIDWNIYFTLMGENPPVDSSCFILVIGALNRKQLKLVREQLFKEVAEDPKLRSKILNSEPLPSIYTFYCNYWIIKREVKKLLKPSSKIAPTGSRSLFLQIEKLTRDEGLSFADALEKVSEAQAVQV